MINVNEEQVFPIRQALSLVPGRNGQSINISTLWRWILDGRRGVKLESLMIGGTRYTSKEAIQRFIEQLNPEQVCAPTIRTASQRQRANERAAKQLAKRLEAAGT